eukprot:802022-Prymnesium_polylepis.1
MGGGNACRPLELASRGPRRPHGATWGYMGLHGITQNQRSHGVTWVGAALTAPWSWRRCAARPPSRRRACGCATRRRKRGQGERAMSGDASRRAVGARGRGAWPWRVIGARASRPVRLGSRGKGSRGKRSRGE